MRQARENLKKIRAMIRRVQNRGYATMSRLAEHLERLTAGDESNAVIDAGDSVSLMTIHAAKGLEFPVVFVVNLSRGTGGRRHAIRVVSDAEHGAGMAERRRLSVGSRRRREGQRPRGDEAPALRGADARARSPVSRVRGEGCAMARVRRQPGRHPAGRHQGALRSRQPLAGARDDGMDGGVRAGAHVQSLCDAASPRRRQTLDLCDNRQCEDRRSTRQTTSLHSSIRSSCRELPSRERCAPAVEKRRRNQIDTSSRSLTGTLVHRLFERFGTSLAGDGGERNIAGELARLIRDEESVEAGDVEQVFEHARDAYLGAVRTAGAVRTRSSRARRFLKCRSPFAQPRRR